MLKFALLGCGKIAVRHANLLASGDIDGATLASVCDVNPAQAETFGKRYGVPFFIDVDEMMRFVNPDVISVLTPGGSHAKNTIQLASYGKPIVVEKPMALTLDDADDMLAACDENGCKLFVVKQNRFNVPVLKLRAALEAGRFGRLVMGSVRVRWSRRQAYYDAAKWRGTWAEDGGVLANQASHHLDLLQWMMGDIESVKAMSRTALVDIEAEDTAIALLKFSGGALGVIEATTATRPVDLEGSLSILGEKGSVVIGGFAANEIVSWNFEDESEEDTRVREHFASNPPDDFGFGHRAYYEHIVSCLNGSSPAVVDGEEGRRSLELITALYESIETGREVEFPFQPKHCRLGIST
jgi:predicted dehydrogenase